MTGFQHFTQFTKKISQLNSLSSKMDHYEDSHNLRRYKISQITINEAQKIYQNIQKKFYKYYLKAQSGSWFENELRLFVWVLICYMEFYKKQIRQFVVSDWTFFSTVFYTKQQVLFQYQAKIIFDYSLCLKRWSQQQDAMLAKIVSGVIKIKWSEIAKSLFIVSEQRYIRTSKQCRQRWLNHLDPSKTKLEWSLEESKALVESVLQKGKKWASLVQILSGRRSQHSIKNKYNSMLIRQSKITPHQTEQQNCRCILEQLNKIIQLTQKQLSFSQVTIQNKNLQKYNEQIRKQQKSLQKSNASLAQTLSFTQGNQHENEQELNFDDLILGISLTKSLGPVKQNMPLSSQNQFNKNKVKKIFGKIRRNSIRNMNCFENQDGNDYGDQNSMDSLVFLHDLKMMIRQSELDR